MKRTNSRNVTVLLVVTACICTLGGLAGCSGNAQLMAGALDQSFKGLKPYVEDGIKADITAGKITENDAVVIRRTVAKHQEAIDTLGKP